MDAEVVRVLQLALEKLFIEVEVCRGVNSGHEILRTEKFDAVIVDCDDLDGGVRVLEGLRKAPSNKNSVTFAILNGTTTTQQAFQMGANFVLQKPISTLNATRCFSATVNFMIREQRRYFRHPVEIPATLEFGEGQKLKATITNISEGGMAIFFGGKFPLGSVSANFKLPGGRHPPGTESSDCLDGRFWASRSSLHRYAQGFSGATRSLADGAVPRDRKTVQLISPFHDRRKTSVPTR